VRQRIGWILFAACLALPVILAFLPATGWAVHNHLRLLTQGRSGNESEWDGIVESVVYPALPDSRDPDGHLAYLLDTRYQATYASKVAQLKNLAVSNPSKSRLSAAYINELFSYEGPYDQRPATYSKAADINRMRERANDQAAKYGRDWDQAISVARQSMKAEPNNAFFPLAVARLELALGVRKSAWKRCPSRLRAVNSTTMWPSKAASSLASSEESLAIAD